MTATDESLIKYDRQGRLRYTLDQRSALLDAFAGSGMSGPQFAAHHGVCYQTFASWRQRQKPNRTLNPPSLPGPIALSFIPAVIESSPTGGDTGSIEVTLRSGAKFTLVSHGQVQLAAALIRELSPPPSC
jgi:hypothetical protein